MKPPDLPAIRIFWPETGAVIGSGFGLARVSRLLAAAQAKNCAVLRRFPRNLGIPWNAGQRLTSAGITAGIDLMFHIVAQDAGHATALAVARYLVVYLRRSGADPARDWSVAALADLAASSPRNLSRLFNEQTGMSVIDYVNRMRIALAHELVTASQLSMELVANGLASPPPANSGAPGTASTRCRRTA